MNSIIEYLTGLNVLTDQVVASDLLIAAKSGVRNYAMAVTEAGTPEMKEMLTRHLEEAIDLHEKISTYMVDNGWYHAFETDQQLQLNIKNINTALKLPTL